MKIILRSEYKPSERRTPLTPIHAKQLIDAGYELFVEESPKRLITTKEYAAIGASIIPEHSWEKEPSNPNTIILGLKELPIELEKISGNHIYFAHIFKGQDHSKETFQQYEKGIGLLYDLEFLQNENGRRVAAFGYWAGYVGAALSLWQYFLSQNNGEIKNLKTFENQEELIKQIKDAQPEGIDAAKAIVIGASGRCGTGARDLLKTFSCIITPWDQKETAKGGPFSELLDHQIFINCVYLSKEIAPFITNDLIVCDSSKLSVIGDVSCDPNGPWNPVRVYNKHTTWEQPILQIEKSETKVIAIDNLPSLLPRESSEDFSEQLIPYLLDLKNDTKGVWARARKIFNDKKAQYI